MRSRVSIIGTRRRGNFPLADRDQNRAIPNTHPKTVTVEVAMDQETGIRSLYDEFFQGYGAEIRLFRTDFRPNSTYKRSSTIRMEL